MNAFLHVGKTDRIYKQSTTIMQVGKPTGNKLIKSSEGEEYYAYIY